MKHKILAALAMVFVVAASSCSYDTIDENKAGLLLEDGKVSEEITDAARVNTFSLAHDMRLVKYDTGVFDSTFTNVAGEGDRQGDDSIRVNTSDKAQPSANVNVSAQFDKSQMRCLFKAGIKGPRDFRDKVLRGETRAATQVYAAMVTAPEFATKRKGEIATAALTYLQHRFGEPIPKKDSAQGETEDATSYAIRTLRPSSQLPDTLACGTRIIRFQITDVNLPPEQQKQLNAIIAAEAARQSAIANQATAEAEAKGKVITAQGNADAQIIAAEAQAQANAKISASMSPQLAQLEAIRACADALAKTQAKIASCGSMGSGGGGTNVITIPAG